VLEGEDADDEARPGGLAEVTPGRTCTATAVLAFPSQTARKEPLIRAPQGWCQPPPASVCVSTAALKVLQPQRRSSIVTFWFPRPLDTAPVSVSREFHGTTFGVASIVTGSPATIIRSSCSWAAASCIALGATARCTRAPRRCSPSSRSEDVLRERVLGADLVVPRRLAIRLLDLRHARVGGVARSVQTFPRAVNSA
jgi:hypothetical protein